MWVLMCMCVTAFMSSRGYLCNTYVTDTLRVGEKMSGCWIVIVCSLFSETNATLHWFRKASLLLNIALKPTTFKVVQEDATGMACFLSFQSENNMAYPNWQTKVREHLLTLLCCLQWVNLKGRRLAMPFPFPFAFSCLSWAKRHTVGKSEHW